MSISPERSFQANETSVKGGWLLEVFRLISVLVKLDQTKSFEDSMTHNKQGYYLRKTPAYLVAKKRVFVSFHELLVSLF